MERDDVIDKFLKFIGATDERHYQKSIDIKTKKELLNYDSDKFRSALKRLVGEQKVNYYLYNWRELGFIITKETTTFTNVIWNKAEKKSERVISVKKSVFDILKRLSYGE